MINSIFNRFNHSIVTEKITIKEAMRLLGKSKIHILILINKNNQLGNYNRWGHKKVNIKRFTIWVIMHLK